MYRKSTTCIGKVSGKPLTEYDTEYEAQIGAQRAQAKHQKDFAYYRCDKCGLWHLTPLHRQTPSQVCLDCADSNGKQKAAYATQDAAKKRAAILWSERRVKLQIYPCPYSKGWHLTKGSGY